MGSCPAGGLCLPEANRLGCSVRGSWDQVLGRCALASGLYCQGSAFTWAVGWCDLWFAQSPPAALSGGWRRLVLGGETWGDPWGDVHHCGSRGGGQSSKCKNRRPRRQSCCGSPVTAQGPSTCCPALAPCAGGRRGRETGCSQNASRLSFCPPPALALLRYN